MFVILTGPPPHTHTFNPSSIVNKGPAEQSQSRLTGICGIPPPTPPTSSDDGLTTNGEDNMELFYDHPRLYKTNSREWDYGLNSQYTLSSLWGGNSGYFQPCLMFVFEGVKDFATGRVEFLRPNEGQLQKSKQHLLSYLLV